jgi:hypothetical protein
LLDTGEEDMAETRGRYLLQIPIDASDNHDLKAGQSVKVLVRDGVTVKSQEVALDAKGIGMARFDFENKPRLAQVVVGPHNASDDELEGLQTIRVDVPARLWADSAELTHARIRIAPYYWHWWLFWCREFVIHGKLVCADGSPVPAATVCAFDVDMWWWWSSTQQVGCATTDANGAFEIRFRWCCGWWPWWWWARRNWRVEPSLAELILPALHTKPGFPPIPRPDPAPDLGIFHRLLSAEGKGQAGRPQPTAMATRAMASTRGAMAMPSTGSVAALGRFDPAALASLQGALRDRLPSIPELEALRLWPWFPWNPWTDCNPDIIFRATQDCQEKGQVVVDETVWNTRWNVPTSMSVTLVANERACCVPPHHGCDEGDCVVLTDACSTQVDHIGGNIGAPAAPAGYANPGLVADDGDRPFGGVVTLSGTAECMSHVDYYEFEWSNDGGATFNPMPNAAAGGFTRSYLDLGPLSFVDVPFNPTLIDGHLVFETLSHYEGLHPPADWGAMRLWMYNRDVLMQWLTENNFSDGTYVLQVKGWDLVAGHLQNPRALDNCGEDHGHSRIVLTLDNRFVGASALDVSGNPLDSHGNRCGAGSVHTCTVEPDTGFLSVKILHDDGTETRVDACGQFGIKDTDWLEVDFWAYDPDGHLAYYTLDATYGVNLDNDLLALGGTLSPCPVPAPVPSAAQVGPGYAAALGQGAASPVWKGGALRLRVKAKAAFPITCCYQLELRAHKRTIVNCDYSLWGHANLSETSFMISV